MRIADMFSRRKELQFRREEDLSLILSDALSLLSGARELLPRLYGDGMAGKSAELARSIQALQEKLARAAPQLKVSLTGLPEQFRSTSWLRMGLARTADRLALARLSLPPDSPVAESLRELSRALADLRSLLSRLPGREVKLATAAEEGSHLKPMPQQPTLPKLGVEPAPREETGPVPRPAGLGEVPFTEARPEEDRRVALVKESLRRALAGYGLSPERIEEILAEAEVRVTDLGGGRWEAEVSGVYAGLRLGYYASFTGEALDLSYIWRLGH